ncbi:hypothetical protein TraAM80_04413 [Trypanosoma rangeli]|uniref:Uncharacterized protein n=1 Tax=Trypanosoma rangeli TaxID=5698 RepID=A0A422NJF2_TRYRA|nr:uncharacterized protein TraAM80_04413 [Trypanosoma rangeli]RNF05587.1 hypothetical protein TraAM80_04413 [Trypanosoma rangeli]|eukprot:RNF05587.1 hypothetical protein TraAM80_04413 [Trypanosoma rangeli]
MRWALTRHRIKPPELLRALHRYRQVISAQSALWLSRTQARAYYRLQCHGGISVKADLFGERNIFYLMEYTSRERKTLLMMQPLPVKNVNRWMLLTTSASGSLSWTAATLDQYAHASLFASGENIFETVLLVDAKVAVPSSPSQSAFVLNAQETSNPFLIDDSLHHTHFATGAPFSHVVGSSLSTLWSQFRYTSLKWLPESGMNDIKGGISVLSGQTPHRVFHFEPVDLVHLRQTSHEYQQATLHSTPRWALLRSLKETLIFSEGRWLTWREMNLDEDLKTRRDRVTTDMLRAPHLPFSFNTLSAGLPYQLWCPCDHTFIYTGLPRRRYIVYTMFFYNSSQLGA